MENEKEERREEVDVMKEGEEEEGGEKEKMGGEGREGEEGEMGWRVRRMGEEMRRRVS